LREKVPHKVLIVEDEMIVALNLRHMLTALGLEVVGIAPDAETAQRLADRDPDIALVDVNLRDGLTGPQIADRLAREVGATVLFVTANPRDVADGIPGVVGVMPKPYDEYSIASAVEFLVSHRAGATPTPPPNLRLFAS
jgi:two-component system, response regulator PdtaR